jgi:hypothetical protein
MLRLTYRDLGCGTFTSYRFGQEPAKEKIKPKSPPAGTIMKRLRLREVPAGKQLKCPACDGKIDLPSASSTNVKAAR